MTGMKIIVDRKYRSLESYVEQLPVTFDTGELVYAARNVLRRFCWDGTIVVVKKYKIPILLNRFVYGRFRKSKARRSFEYARILNEKGFRTPQPVAYIEERCCRLLSDSYLVTLNEDFPEMMRRFHTDESLTDEGKMILRAFAAYTRDLHEAGILHQDYSPGNIAFKVEDGRVEFSLFDINRMHFGRISKKMCLRTRQALQIGRCPFLFGRRVCPHTGWNVEESVCEAVSEQAKFFSRSARRSSRKQSLRTIKSRFIGR